LKRIGASIRQKLDIKTRAELVRFAVLWVEETRIDDKSLSEAAQKECISVNPSM
jgi:hypothetical protein